MMNAADIRDRVRAGAARSWSANLSPARVTIRIEAPEIDPVVYTFDRGYVVGHVSGDHALVEIGGCLPGMTVTVEHGRFEISEETRRCLEQIRLERADMGPFGSWRSIVGQFVETEDGRVGFQKQPRMDRGAAHPYGVRHAMIAAGVAE